MRWLITGGTGFIGASLGTYLDNHGEQVTLLSREPDFSIPIRRLPYPASYYDLCSLISTEDPDFIFHAAGSSSIDDSWSDPETDFCLSVLLWQSFLGAVRESGTHPVLFFPSSAAVYGNPDVLPISENSPVRPISPYGFHKRIGEQLAMEYAEMWNIPVWVLRIFSLYGPRQHRLLIREIFDQISSRSDSIHLKGNGLEERDYLYIDDFAKAVLLLSKVYLEGFQLINVGSGHSDKILDLVQSMQLLSGTNKPVFHQQSHMKGHPRHWRADKRKLLSLIPEWRSEPSWQSLSKCLKSWMESEIVTVT